MQAYVANRSRWPLWLVTVLVFALAATWWWRSSDDGAVSAPIATISTAQAPVVAPAATSVIAPTPIAAAAKPVNAALSASAFKLVGTVMAKDGTDSFALVRRTADSQLMQLHAGDHVEGLIVSAIESDSVVLAGAGQAVVIETDRTVASPTPFHAISPPPEPEAAWAGDPAPFGH
jgi:type II secretory pathway component PulC